MQNDPPIAEVLPVNGKSALWTPGWANWFFSVLRGLTGWRASVTVQVSLDFPLIAPQSQATLDTPMDGANPGDGIQVTTAQVAGVAFSAFVVSAGSVRVVAANYSAAGVNPPAQSFTLIGLLQ